jgi:hypothetical protein
MQEKRRGGWEGGGGQKELRPAQELRQRNSVDHNIMPGLKKRLRGAFPALRMAGGRSCPSGPWEVLKVVRVGVSGWMS